MNYNFVPDDSPLLDFDIEPQHLDLNNVAIHRATAAVMASDPTVLAGLRQAYVHGADSGVIETLTLHRQLFFPRSTRVNVFRFPSGTAAVVANEGGRVELAELYLDMQRWTALQRGPSDAHFLTPTTIAAPYADRVIAVADIERDSAMRPSLPALAIARNGERYFFSATVVYLMHSNVLTMRAQDGVYGEILARAREGRYGAGRFEARAPELVVALAYVMWMAEALSLKLRLGAFYDDAESVLRRHYRYVRAVLHSEAPRLVPLQLQFFSILNVGPAPTGGRVMVSVVCDVDFDADADTRTYAVRRDNVVQARSVQERDVSPALLLVAAVDAEGALLPHDAAGALAIGVTDGAWVTVRGGVASVLSASPVF